MRYAYECLCHVHIKQVNLVYNCTLYNLCVFAHLLQMSGSQSLGSRGLVTALAEACYQVAPLWAACYIEGYAIGKEELAD